MTNNVSRCKFHVRILIGDVFGSVGPQKKTTYELGFVFKLYRKIDSVILVQNAATADRETSITIYIGLFQTVHQMKVNKIY